ncbi:MAG: hypothetical protein ACR2JE_13555 [Acidobacteriaceae bacterium]
MTNSMKSMLLAAAVTGLVGGASTQLQAQPVAGQLHGTNPALSSAVAGAASHAATDQQKPKHACKGQNACKGQGADGKNACKGQGSCATDGSKPPA